MKIKNKKYKIFQNKKALKIKGKKEQKIKMKDKKIRDNGSFLPFKTEETYRLKPKFFTVI